MAESGKIYVILTDKRGQQPEPTPPTPETPSTPKPKKEEKNKYLSAALKVGATVAACAIQAANWSLNNIGNFTGDYQKQRQVQAVKGALLKGAGFVGAVAAGGVLGAVAYTAAMAVDFTLSETSNQIQFAKQNYDIRQLRQISGLDGLTNGGRI